MARLTWFLSALAATAGCLPDEIRVEGKSLFAGRNIEAPAFTAEGGKLSVTFQVRTALPKPPRSGTYDQWMVGWDDGQQHKIIAGVANRDLWTPAIDPQGIHYYMVDERMFEGPQPTGSTPVATLARVDLDQG